MSGTARRPRILALAEGAIPSAVLGVNAVLAALAAEGACELRTGLTVAPRREDLAWADSAILVRGASPAERRILLEARRLGRKVATYLDDDLERVPAEARSGYFFTSETVRANVAFIVRHADLVLVCSDRLAAELGSRHGVVPVLLRQPRPPSLPGESEAVRARLGLAAAGGAGESPDPPTAASFAASRGRRGPVRVGFLGSVDHAAFLEALLAAPLRRLKAELGERLELVFCGAVPPFARQLRARCEEFEPALEAWRRRALALDLDVGLAPLPDTPFHRCKYFNKYLEYASLGVAGIYSSVPPSADAVTDGVTGLLCPGTPGAWETALRRLLDDPALRSRIARAAYRDVEERFSSAALREAWLAALAPLLEHHAPSVAPGEVRLRGGALRHALDRLAVYGPTRFTERVLGRVTGRLRPG